MTPEAKFKDDLGLDSLDTVEVTARRLLQFSRIAAPTLYFFLWATLGVAYAMYAMC